MLLQVKKSFSSFCISAQTKDWAIISFIVELPLLLMDRFESQVIILAYTISIAKIGQPVQKMMEFHLEQV